MPGVTLGARDPLKTLTQEIKNELKRAQRQHHNPNKPQPRDYR